jgi:peptide/nickel transport system substrate-binding protein
LAISRNWIDDTTLDLWLRQGVRFHNGESFDANAVKFNFEFQRKHNPNREIQHYLKNLKKVGLIGPHTVRFLFDQPDALLLVIEGREDLMA